MLTPTIVLIACGLIIWKVVLRRIREYKEEREEIVQQAAHYDHGC